MDTLKKKKTTLADRKNALVYLFWMLVNKICILIHFRKFEIIGRENIPACGPFLLLSNHISRWDGLIVYETIARPSNFMVSPNELSGFQGAVLSSMGSFPADPRADLISHSLKMFRKGEGIVVFPEGNIFRDGKIHPFKNGAARIALSAAAEGLDLPIIPAAISYDDESGIATISIGTAVKAGDYLYAKADSQNNTARVLSNRMHREVCGLRESAGNGTNCPRLITTARSCSWSEEPEQNTKAILMKEAG